AHLIREVLPVVEELGVKVQDTARKSSIQNSKRDQNPVDSKISKTLSDISITKISPKLKTSKFSSSKMNKLTVPQDNTANHMLQSVIKKEIPGANTDYFD